MTGYTSSNNRTAAAGMLKQTDKALSTPLPRVFDTEPSTGKPVPSAPAVMGTENENVEDGVRVGTLTALADETGEKMEHEVLAPMEQWLRLFQVAALASYTIHRSANAGRH